jgi:hypothetical protein
MLNHKSSAKYKTGKGRSTNAFFMPFTVIMLLVVVCLVGEISNNKMTTGNNLVLPQFETNKGVPMTPWLHQREVDKRFWRAAYSMAGAPIQKIEHGSNHIVRGKQRALIRLMLKMKHDIEVKGLISKAVEVDLIKSYMQKQPR